MIYQPLDMAVVSQEQDTVSISIKEIPDCLLEAPLQATKENQVLDLLQFSSRGPTVDLTFFNLSYNLPERPSWWRTGTTDLWKFKTV